MRAQAPGPGDSESGIWGAWRNVVVNMGDIDEGEWKNTITAEAQALVERAQRESSTVLEILNKRS